MPQKHIALYNTANVSRFELEQALSESFNGVAIVHLDAEDLKKPNALNKDTLLFVLPGIVDENSPYPAEIGEDGIEVIRDYIEEGGTFLGSCAGAYFASDITVYNPPWYERSKKQAMGLSFFNGLAYGPLEPMCIHDEEDTWYSDCTVADVTYTSMDKAVRRAAIAYGNGPALFPYPREEEKLNIIARYADVTDTPIAIASKVIGKGIAMFTGVLPFMGYTASHETSNSPRLRTLMQQLKPHETARKELWDIMMDEIKAHHKKFEPSP